jgi:two-component system response regulator
MSVRAAQSQSTLPLILLIEDDANDVFLFRRALSQLSYQCDLRVVDTVSEARRYMGNEGEYKDANYFRRPDLIVSDFRLAGHTSQAFVEWLRSQPDLAATPVVMLSGVISGLDPALFVGLAVNSFLRKSADVTALGATLQPFLPKT